MTYIVDQLFPPIRDDEGDVEYSNFNYWRDPIPDLDLVLDNTTTTAIEAATSNNNEVNAMLQKGLATIPEN